MYWLLGNKSIFEVHLNIFLGNFRAVGMILLLTWCSRVCPCLEHIITSLVNVHIRCSRCFGKLGYLAESRYRMTSKVTLFCYIFGTLSGRLSFQFYLYFLHVGCGDLSAVSWCCSSSSDWTFSFTTSVTCCLTVSFYLLSVRAMLGTPPDTEKNLQMLLACPEVGSVHGNVNM